MKKIITVLLISAILMSVTISLSSCSTTGVADLMAFLEQPKTDNLSWVVERMERQDYSCEYYNVETELENIYKITELAMMSKDSEYLIIIKFSNPTAASATYNMMEFIYDSAVHKLERERDEYKDLLLSPETDNDSDEDVEDCISNIINYNKQLNSIRDDLVFGKSGNTVWFGTPQATADSWT